MCVGVPSDMSVCKNSWQFKKKKERTSRLPNYLPPLSSHPSLSHSGGLPGLNFESDILCLPNLNVGSTKKRTYICIACTSEKRLHFILLPRRTDCSQLGVAAKDTCLSDQSGPGPGPVTYMQQASSSRPPLPFSSIPV